MQRVRSAVGPFGETAGHRIECLINVANVLHIVGELECVEQFERGADPERVARVPRLVDASVEARVLSIQAPSGQLVELALCEHT